MQKANLSKLALGAYITVYATVCAKFVLRHLQKIINRLNNPTAEPSHNSL
jgi:hypothetical protein